MQLLAPWRPLVVDPRLDPQRCPGPTCRQLCRREALGQELSARASRRAQTHGEVTSHPALSSSSPPKCLCLQLWDLRVRREK